MVINQYILFMFVNSYTYHVRLSRLKIVYIPECVIEVKGHCKSEWLTNPVTIKLICKFMVIIMKNIYMSIIKALAVCNTYDSNEFLWRS